MILYLLVILSATNVAKGRLFQENEAKLIKEHSNTEGYVPMALENNPQFAIIVRKLYDILSKPDVLQILKNEEFRNFIEPKNLIQHVKGIQYTIFMNPETTKALLKSPIYAPIVSSPEMIQIIQEAGIGYLVPKLPQIFPLLLGVFLERVKSKKPLPKPVEEFGQKLGFIPSAEALQLAELDAVAKSAEDGKSTKEAFKFQQKRKDNNLPYMVETKYTTIA